MEGADRRGEGDGDGVCRNLTGSSDEIHWPQSPNSGIDSLGV